MFRKADEMIKTLDQFVPGDQGEVVKVSGQGAIRRRLLDMGITPGTRILLIKTAPMGDPLEITLRGFNLSIRKEDARYIELNLDSSEEEPNA